MTFRNPKTKFYFTVSLFIVIFGVIFLIVIPRLIKEIKSAGDSVMTSKNRLEELKNREGLLNLYEKKYQKISQKMTDLERVLVKIDEIGDFILTVGKIANKTSNDLRIEILSYEEQPKTLAFRIYLVGTFPNLLKFLNYLENMPYFINIDKIQVRSASQTLGGKKIVPVNSVIDIKIYTENIFK